MNNLKHQSMETVIILILLENNILKNSKKLHEMLYYNGYILNGNIIAPTKKWSIRKSEGKPLVQSGKKRSVIIKWSILFKTK